MAVQLDGAAAPSLAQDYWTVRSPRYHYFHCQSYQALESSRSRMGIGAFFFETSTLGQEAEERLQYVQYIAYVLL